MTNGKAWDTFYRKLQRKSASTQDQYKRGLLKFCEYWQIVPEELYQKQLEIIRGVQSGAIDPRDDDQVVDMVRARATKFWEVLAIVWRVCLVRLPDAVHERRDVSRTRD